MAEILEHFGLTTEESRVYRALLAIGAAKASDIAKKLAIKRTSCREYLISLEEKGFINSSKVGNKYFYQAEDPDRFRQIVNEREFLVDRLLPEIRKISLGEEWSARIITQKEEKKVLKRAQKKELKINYFGDEMAGGTPLGDKKIILHSQNKDIPIAEINSLSIVELHKKLLKK